MKLEGDGQVILAGDRAPLVDEHMYMKVLVLILRCISLSKAVEKCERCFVLYLACIPFHLSDSVHLLYFHLLDLVPFMVHSKGDLIDESPTKRWIWFHAPGKLH